MANAARKTPTATTQMTQTNQQRLDSNINLNNLGWQNPAAKNLSKTTPLLFARKIFTSAAQLFVTKKIKSSVKQSVKSSDLLKKNIANSIKDMVWEPQLGAVCKSVAIANMLNYLNAVHGAKQSRTHALHPEIVDIFNQHQKKQQKKHQQTHQQKYVLKVLERFSLFKRSLVYFKKFKNFVFKKFNLNQNKYQNKHQKPTVVEVLQATKHSVQGEILLKSVFLEGLLESAKQNWQPKLAEKVHADFLKFNDYTSFKKTIAAQLQNGNAVSVFFNMNFPLKKTDLKSVKTEKCAEFYEHIAVVTEIFEEKGEDFVKIHHFGRTFIERLADVYQSNQNLQPRAKEGYIQNTSYQSIAIKKLLKQQYDVKTTADLNKHLRALIDSAEIFTHDEHQLAYLFTREYLTEERYQKAKNWYENSINIQNNKNNKIKILDNFFKQQHVYLESNMLVDAIKDDNVFKNYILVAGLNNLNNDFNNADVPDVLDVVDPSLQQIRPLTAA